MKTFLLLLLCLPAYAATPPMPSTTPTVRRTAPALSPRHASQPKSTPMFVPSSENPPLPMTYGVALTPEGDFFFVAGAFKPKNTGLTMEWSTVPKGSWHFLAGWGAYPEDQWVSGTAWTSEPRMFIRATPGTTAARLSGPSVTFPGRFVKLPSTKTRPR